MKNFNLMLMKLIISITSIFLLIFIIIHCLGNVGIYFGKSYFNNYAELLHKNKIILWGFRITLLSTFLIHIFFSIIISIKNKLAKPINYTDIELQYSDLSSRLSLQTGIFILFFLIFHLLHLTIGKIDTDINSLINNNSKDIYNIVIISFKKSYIVLIYIISIIMLFSHIKHGIFSLQQTLGIIGKISIEKSKIISSLLSIILIFLYTSIPITIYLGWII